MAQRLPPLIDFEPRRRVVTPFDRERYARRRPMTLALLIVAIMFALGLVVGVLVGWLAAV